MNEMETLIRTMSKEGNRPRAIATELYKRGLKNPQGKFLMPDHVESFLRHIGAPAPAPAPDLKPARHRKEADPIGEPLPKVRVLRPWPLNTDFSPDNLNVRD